MIFVKIRDYTPFQSKNLLKIGLHQNFFDYSFLLKNHNSFYMLSELYFFPISIAQN